MDPNQIIQETFTKAPAKDNIQQETGPTNLVPDSEIAVIQKLQGSPLKIPRYKNADFYYLTGVMQYKHFCNDMNDVNQHTVILRRAMEESWAYVCRVKSQQFANKPLKDNSDAETKELKSQLEHALLAALLQADGYEGFDVEEYWRRREAIAVKRKICMKHLHGISPFSPFDAVHPLTETKFPTLDQGVMTNHQALFNHETGKFYPTPIEELERLGNLPERNKIDLSAPEISKNDEDYMDDIMSIDLSNDDIGDGDRVWPPPSPKAPNRKERRAEQKRAMEAAAAWASESQIPDEPTEQLAFRPAIKRKHDTDDEAANSRPPPHLR